MIERTTTNIYYEGNFISTSHVDNNQQSHYYF